MDNGSTPAGSGVPLRIAGPGARSYAFIVDWHIRLLAAVLWLGLSALSISAALRSGWPSRATTANPLHTYVLFVLLPSLAIYLLYHPVVEVFMRGATPGKRIAGVRLVDRDGSIPGTGALLTRNLSRVIDSLPFAYLVGLTAVMLSERSQRIGDILAGTFLVYEHNEARSDIHDAATQRGGTRGADLVKELLERWPDLDGSARRELARQLLSRFGIDFDPEADESELHAALQNLLAGHREESMNATG